MSDKVEAYKILEAATPWELTREVNLLIEKGWIPQGGLVYRHPIAASGVAFYQTMIKYSPYV